MRQPPSWTAGKRISEARMLPRGPRAPWHVDWSDVEQLLLALGAEIGEGRGSRVRIHLRGVRAVFHRPHPRKETDKGSLSSLRRFLRAAGVDVEQDPG
jgi:hypothetical protein